MECDLISEERDALRTRLAQAEWELDDWKQGAFNNSDRAVKFKKEADAWRTEAERLAGVLELVVNHGKEAREGYGPEFDPVELAAVKAIAEYEAFKKRRGQE